jgi:hypothetical protein
MFVVATVAHVIAAYIFLGKDKPRQMLLGLPITYLAVDLVWIVIRMVSRCMERTSLRTERSDGEPNTESVVNTKALAKNDDAEQSQAGTKAVIEEEEEEPHRIVIEKEEKEPHRIVVGEEEEEPHRIVIKEEEEEPSKAERKQIEDDGGAGKASDDGWLSWIAIAFLLVITWLASPLLGPARPHRPGPRRSRSARSFRMDSLQSMSARSFRLGSVRSRAAAPSFRVHLF